ncbi:MAG: phosphatase PAP2 family protein [Proteiniphilum sp.]|nr:phosphatase PAP2 family protein [Proteiniphilum sp.]MDD4800625.1 phosphatase PAP2 family protein [Proteiniphilum sp.]
MKTIAHVISTIFQPLLMPTYGVMLIFVYTYFGMIYLPQFWQIILPAVLFSFTVPALLILMLYRMRIISDLSLKIRRERFYPYLITLLSYSVMIVYYFRMRMPVWFLMIMVASVVIMVIAILVTFTWKISAHMFGVGGLIGGSMAVSYFVERSNPYYMFMGLFIIAGLIGTSRLILRRHTLHQVIAGFLLGFLVSFVFVWGGTQI